MSELHTQFQSFEPKTPKHFGLYYFFTTVRVPLRLLYTKKKCASLRGINTSSTFQNEEDEDDDEKEELVLGGVSPLTKRWVLFVCGTFEGSTTALSLKQDAADFCASWLPIYLATAGLVPEGGRRRCYERRSSYTSPLSSVSAHITFAAG